MHRNKSITKIAYPLQKLKTFLFHLITHGCRHQSCQSFQSSDTGSCCSDWVTSSQKQLLCLYDFFQAIQPEIAIKLKTSLFHNLS